MHPSASGPTALRSGADDGDLAVSLRSAPRARRLSSSFITSVTFVSTSLAVFPNRCGGVTGREREIIQLLAEGQSNKEAAATLGVSVKTIEAHRANIMRKLRFRSVSDLVRYAIRNQIVQP